ncbi:MAG: PVC-type heme-binding CxxCH protein [Verrucomicrobiales bacterium]
MKSLSSPLSLVLGFVVLAPVPWSASAQSASPGGKTPEEELAALDVAEGLEATLFASEPMLLSPSAIDIDERGRVWVAEIVNYRLHNGKRPEGDRILILEETDGDGKADQQKVFYQGRDIDSPHGVCVLGNKVIISANGKVHLMTDENGDDKPDKVEVMFSGISGAQHDHGIHQFMFGPDGRLYFNIGNDGGQVRDKDGKPIVDLDGNEVGQTRKPYQQGMIFRCELDGSNFETVAWNFRNNWEVTVDSFGTIWQSDNDDDGNKAVRICYVMEFGNFGYKDELTGAGWQEPRTNLEPEIPLRHWHLNDPGVVPSLLITGAGSPTGIMVNEGDLLPAVFRNQMIHCDAGPNVVRAYPVKKHGAGYSADTVNVVEGARDKWFRPSDVLTAPDGSLMVADWYDPGVGGHAMGDLDRGRIFRIAPRGNKYAKPKLDLTTPAGATIALRSPNGATRYRAYIALRGMGRAAESELTRLWKDANPRLRARALWLLGQLDGAAWVKSAIADDDEDIRVTGLRLARRLKLEVVPIAELLRKDPSPQVRRECAIALRHNQHSDMPRLWADLAAQHDGRDRWYLEALGIGADRAWDRCLDAYLGKAGGDSKARATAAGLDIIWRSRAKKTPALLVDAISDPAFPNGELSRFLRAFDFQQDPERRSALEDLAARLTTADRAPAMVQVIQKLPSFNYASASEAIKGAINQHLSGRRGAPDYFDIVDRFNVRDEKEALLKLARDKSDENPGASALKLLIKWGETAAIQDLISSSGEAAASILGALGAIGQRPALELLQKVIAAPEKAALGHAAVEALARSRSGERELLNLAKANKLPEPLKQSAARLLGGSSDEGLRHEAAQVLAMAAPAGPKLPPAAELAKRTGQAQDGKAIFLTHCQTCHQIGGQGINLGPALDEIGSKLPKEQLHVSILDPNQGISFGFEGWEVQVKDGTTLVGVITSETDKEITLRGIGGIDNKIPKADIMTRKKLPISLMPPLAQALNESQLVDLVEFLSTLKKK